MKLTRFLHILAVTLALAGYAAWVSAEREQDAASAAIPASRGGIPLIRGDEAESLWRGGSTVFLDVRSATEFAYGHIAGAVHLPEEEIEQRLPALKPRLERAKVL